MLFIFSLVISCLISSCIVDISKENCVLVKGKVERIFEGGELDVVIKLSGDNNIYYINRGLERGLVMDNLQKDLIGKEIEFWHAKTWVQNGGHITQVAVDKKILYTEWED